ncbi:hypothetical protein L3X38_002200 [Prunus dulcis]|uniref:Uncharacterized protein n=1 Tax=Prunus dulcis TaxID=3755 RepID=A0AAD4ZKZ8_PRUDU|nr:hypothetical protein L3X38_002200 [Prunus dulcis]
MRCTVGGASVGTNMMEEIIQSVVLHSSNNYYDYGVIVCFGLKRLRRHQQFGTKGWYVVLRQDIYMKASGLEEDCLELPTFLLHLDFVEVFMGLSF